MKRAWIMVIFVALVATFFAGGCAGQKNNRVPVNITINGEKVFVDGVKYKSTSAVKDGSLTPEINPGKFKTEDDEVPIYVEVDCTLLEDCATPACNELKKKYGCEDSPPK